MHLKYFIILAVFIFSVVAYQSFTYARPHRVNQVPNGTVNQCATCHAVPNPAPGNGPRNSFGQMVESRFLTVQNSSGDVVWGPVLASLDADGDGILNGEELQDLFGAWQIEDPQPGSSELVTRPGDSTSNNLSNLHVNFSGMTTAHAGQQLEIRVIDKSTGMEAGREEVSSIPASDFIVDLPVILPGHSYWIDFYADFNGNSLYDAPPTDHAWRLSLDDAVGEDTVNFSHNTDFTDINWVYALTVRFSGMSPHLGDLMEIRVTNQSTSQEISRKRVESITAEDFDVELPGLQLGQNYNVDFYADLNGNFLYDAPMTDHAWRESFSSSEGDVRVDFSHNFSFTDINWEYNFRLNLTGMDPHVGQKFELRLIEDAGGTEIGRISLDSILVPDFVGNIPGILPGNSYHADFYADFNKNGSYDSPPTDHAWRITFTDTSGDVVENFSHNMIFTDIDFPTAIISLDNPEMPESFTLNQNYPNPFNPETRIRFTVPMNSTLKMEVFNMLGQSVRVLVDDFLSADTYEVTWDGKNTLGQQLSSGMYMYKLTSGDFVQTKRMILMK